MVIHRAAKNLSLVHTSQMRSNNTMFSSPSCLSFYTANDVLLAANFMSHFLHSVLFLSAVAI